MAMNTEVKTNEEVMNNTQVATQQVENQPAEQEQPKKKVSVKGVLKKVGIGLGVAAAAVGTFAAGYATGSHNSKSNSEGALSVDDNQPSDDAQ